MTSKPMQVGITGGIGSGKSVICKIFACFGVPVYDADSRAKSLMTTDVILIEKIKETFGNLSYQANGLLNRTFLAQEVFANSEKLKQLNQLVHPRVKLDYENWVAANRAHAYTIKEAALLYESGSYQLLDEIIVVAAPIAMRAKRVLARDPQRTPLEVEQIMNKQLNDNELIGRASFVIYNDETQLIVPQVLKLHERFNQGVSK